MSRGRIIEFVYKDTVFELKEMENWQRGNEYCIADLKKYGEVVEVPNQANGQSIARFFNSDNYNYSYSRSYGYGYGYGATKKDEKNYPKVKKLIIASHVDISGLANGYFPDLEEIELPARDGNGYSTDGKLIYSDNGATLYLVMCAGREDTVTVPKRVKKLSHKAFQNTTCRHIIFENPDVQPDASTFDWSAWLESFEERGEPVYVGNTLYKVFSDKPLTVHPNTVRFFKDAFKAYIPREITTHILPPLNLMREDRYNRKACKILTLTMEKKKINWDHIAQWGGLEAIHFTNHNLYQDLDGVVFSKDGSTLLYYPQDKTDKTYVIPEQTKIIGRRAFSAQKHLEKLSMGDGVEQIYQRAFVNCEYLKEIRLSDNIRELPDATVFQPGGVFEGCAFLAKVHLPQNLEHMGTYAFAGCRKLTKVDLPPKIRMIGEYAFWDTGLIDLSLPKSVTIVGKGALLFDNRQRPTVHAYEGTARGLVGALEAVEPGLSESTANLSWRPASIVMLDEKGHPKDEIILPETLKRASGLYIDIAWNQAQFDYDTYDGCFEDIGSADEKRDIVLKVLATDRDITDSPYEAYLKRAGGRVIDKLIATCDETRVVDFLKYGVLSKPALKKALQQCTDKGYNTAAAYILNLVDEGKVKKEVAIRI
ncbi:MAG: leucine-rich repeat domain-containing protein [Selenomonadaceae bacterium]|nr:leucine-rich repeat domain-containing protein [Selenomonadaceae bacterium]